jgi:hypothetical protein
VIIIVKGSFVENGGKGRKAAQIWKAPPPFSKSFLIAIVSYYRFERKCTNE